MRWKAKDPFRWKRWFAWRPVKIGDTAVWLEWIERRFYGDCYNIRLIPEWPYCCDQMRGEMWRDGKHRPEWCPVHNPQALAAGEAKPKDNGICQVTGKPCVRGCSIICAEEGEP